MLYPVLSRITCHARSEVVVLEDENVGKATWPRAPQNRLYLEPP